MPDKNVSYYLTMFTLLKSFSFLDIVQYFKFQDQRERFPEHLNKKER